MSISDFESKFAASRNELYCFSFKLTKDHDCAEDLVQVVAVKGFLAIETYRSGYSFKSWLFQIAKNAFLDQRRLRRARECSLDAMLEEGFVLPVEQEFSLEAEDLLCGATSRSGERDADLLLIALLSGKTEDSAIEMGISGKALRKRIGRLRRHLRRELGPVLLN